MNKTIVIYIKAFGAFGLPMLAALTAGLAPFTATGSLPPSHIAVVIIIATGLGAGLTGLTSFLSRSYADHQDETDATNEVQPKPPVAPATTVIKP
jgi:hypothetical protein